MWNSTPDERLREWKQFRETIGQLPLLEACIKTTHLWSYAPYVAHYLDPNQKESVVSWPDPWTLLYNNYYCDVAKSLGMLYTLYLSKHASNNIELLLGVDIKSKEPYNIVSVDNGKYILNLEFDTVVNKEQVPLTFIIKHKYTATDLNLDQF